jgi:undecaprenyl-diphosphatase
MFAPLPGVSRSGLTVAAALALGLSRSWAVGFSLLIAVPAILGAAVFEFRKLDPTLLTPDRVARTVSATVLAGAVGYGAIIWLVKIVRSGRLWYFSVYLVALATVVLTAVAFSGGTRDARSASALDRPIRVGAAGSSVAGGGGRAPGDLDCAVADGAGPGAAGPGAAPQGWGRARTTGLVLGRPLASDP